MVAIAKALKVNSTLVSVPITAIENGLAESSQSWNVKSILHFYTCISPKHSDWKWINVKLQFMAGL